MVYHTWWFDLGNTMSEVLKVKSHYLTIFWVFQSNSTGLDQTDTILGLHYALQHRAAE
jgi:hypothetical protein